MSKDRRMDILKKLFADRPEILTEEYGKRELATRIALREDEESLKQTVSDHIANRRKMIARIQGLTSTAEKALDNVSIKASAEKIHTSAWVEAVESSLNNHVDPFIPVSLTDEEYDRLEDFIIESVENYGDDACPTIRRAFGRFYWIGRGH